MKSIIALTVLSVLSVSVEAANWDSRYEAKCKSSPRRYKLIVKSDILAKDSNVKLESLSLRDLNYYNEQNLERVETTKALAKDNAIKVSFNGTNIAEVEFKKTSNSKPTYVQMNCEVKWGSKKLETDGTYPVDELGSLDKRDHTL